MIAENAQPLMLQPMWITVVVQLLTLLVAAGISYGMTRAKLSTNEKEITALRRDLTQLQLDLQKWQRDRQSSVVTSANCHSMQADCRASICGKIDTLTTKLDNFIGVEQKKDQQLALVIGAICRELKIDLPDLT